MKSVVCVALGALILALDDASFVVAGGGFLTCGTSLTSPCLGDTDVRYDAHASDALADQANIWKILHGLFVCEQRYYHGKTGAPLRAADVGLSPATLSLSPTTVFYNTSQIGSRSYGHALEIVPNTEEGGDPHVVPFDFYSTSTYERDGRALILGLQSGFSSEPFGLPVKPRGRRWPPHPGDRGGSGYRSRGPTSMYAADDYSLYIKTSSLNFFTTKNFSAVHGDTETDYNEVLTCLDDSCSKYTSNLHSFIRDEGNMTLSTTSVLVCNKEESEESWNQALLEAYEKHSVPPDQQVPIPMQGQCFTGACPTEEQWCTQDPVCSESPYQEPDASLSVNAFVAFVVSSFMVLAGVVVYANHKRSTDAVVTSHTDDETEGDMTDDDSAPDDEYNGSQPST